MIVFLGDGPLAYLCYQELVRRGVHVCLQMPSGSHNHELLVSVQHASKIDVRMLRSFRLAVNLHTGLLPNNKGVDTYAAPILRGDTETGLTLHEMTDVIDGGDILMQCAYSLLSTDTCESLYYKGIAEGAALFRRFVDALQPYRLGRIGLDRIEALRSTKRPQPPGGYRTRRGSIDFRECLDETDPLFERKLRAYYFPLKQFPIVIRGGKRFRVTSLLPVRYEPIEGPPQ